MLNVDESGVIQLTRGDTARLSVTIDNLISEDVYELGHADTLTLSIKRRFTDPEPCVQKTVVGSNVFHIEPADTQGLEFKKYFYDVQLTTSFGDVYTVIPPTTFEILKEVTC